MKKKLLGSRFRTVFTVLGICAVFAAIFGFSENSTVAGPDSESGLLEKMIVANGSVALDVDLGLLSGAEGISRTENLAFEAEKNAFFAMLVFNNEIRGTIPSMLPIHPQQKANLPAKLQESYERLAIESLPAGGQYELILRDSKTGFHFFNVDGPEFAFDPETRTITITAGRVLVSDDLAAELERPDTAGKSIGSINISTKMRTIETARIVNGGVESGKLPAGYGMEDNAGTVPGPDVIVGDVYGLAQFGSASNGFVGLAVGTNSCNAGTVDLNWFALPSNDHPVIPQNMYRMSGGTNGEVTFEQIGQSSMKHAFTALTQNLCGFGCNGVGGSRLGSGCSDPYSASLNAGPSLGSRAWVNPFTGFYPRGDSATPPNSHSGHTHLGPDHRILTKIDDLRTDINQGARYYAEAQYVTPHEYQWCLANPTQCNMYNNMSYRRYTVGGTAGSFTFSPAENTVRQKPAVYAWPEATVTEYRIAGGADGAFFVAYKVTQIAQGTWQYEYAIFNHNLDRSIGSFSVPTGQGVSVTNVGFHAPPQHPGWTGDGTVGNAGYSSTPWAVNQTPDSVSWATETFAQNPNANAIRWGTMYNFRFTSTSAPTTKNATIGFFKTGEPMTVPIQAPGSSVVASVSVSGRVTDANGFGIPLARVTITDGQGASRSVLTTSFGYYTISNVVSGQTYTIGASAKRYTFPAPQQVPITTDVANLNFVGNE